MSTTIDRMALKDVLTLCIYSINTKNVRATLGHDCLLDRKSLAFDNRGGIMPRIPSTELRFIRRRLFESRFTASALAARVQLSANTFWVMFHRHGISTNLARKIADVLFDWSHSLRMTADGLYELAAKYDDLKQEKTA